MTESEAREKWCPAVNIRSKDGKNINCIASDCMAWRFGRKLVDRPSAKHSGTEVVEIDVGFCGLAGKP